MPMRRALTGIVVGGVATVGLLAGCSSASEPVSAVSSSLTANPYDFPSFSDFIDCIPEESFAEVEFALNSYEEGTAARVDVAEALETLAASFGVASMEPIEGETSILAPEALVAYAGTEKDLRRARAQLLDNPDYTIRQAASAVEQARAVRSQHQPLECADIRGDSQ